MTDIRDSVLSAIGNTPVVRLRKLAAEGSADVIIKLEFYNPTGSYKDRMALAMIEGAERRGTLRPGMRVIEYTGGSTGSSLALVCSVKGYPFVALSSDAWSEEKLRTMRAFGAEVRVFPSEGGKVTPGLIQILKAEAERLAAEPGTFYANQFNNRDAIEGYRGIGTELLAQAGPISVFCGGVGTAGMLAGVSQALKPSGTRIIALEPVTSPVLTAGHGGPHRVEGMGVGFVPPHLTPDVYDEARAINEAEARVMARRLAREEGIFGGVSTGLNVVAALQLARELGPGHTVATVAVDTGLKYLAGDLFAS
ncbi:MAG TPA: cysteine synthase family protein [Thermoanaerobaculia bacterium]|jgi:cysteine synthase A|nr:cysteine synthase family protein [Thermoanaerobaculia bacterium]